MTYEEMKQGCKALEKEQDKTYMQYQRKIDRMKLKYVKEHQPLEVKKYQHIKARLRVTQETNDAIYDKKEKQKKRNQPGYEYNVIGVFIGWYIGENGDVRPCFYGNKTYSRYDEVLSVELTEYQPEGDCSKCRLYKEGLCYMAGGVDMGKRYATHKVQDGDIPCPKYEERMVLYDRWKAGVRYPHVTKVRRNGKTTYRVYNHDWGIYTEYDEKDVQRFYTFEPQEEL